MNYFVDEERKKRFMHEAAQIYPEFNFEDEGNNITEWKNEKKKQVSHLNKIFSLCYDAAINYNKLISEKSNISEKKKKKAYQKHFSKIVNKFEEEEEEEEEEEKDPYVIGQPGSGDNNPFKGWRTPGLTRGPAVSQEIIIRGAVPDIPEG